METRQRNQTRVPQSELVGKTMGGTARQRTTLGQINKASVSSQDGVTKPVVRTTRAQQLRKKMNDRKTEKTAPKQAKPATVTELKSELAPVEPMEISMVNTELAEKIAAIEAKDATDDCHVGPYVNECYEYLRYKEHEMAIPPRYLDGQSDITPKMRSILVDWLVQVHKRFRLQSETLYLTVTIMDRYLYSSTNVSKNDMQLIGVTAMMIACKYEEIYSPEIDDFVYICDNAYKADEILMKELEIFAALDYNLGFPMSIQFLRRYSKTGYEIVDGTQHALAKYCLELSLMDYDLCTLKPSVLAAAALKLSMEVLAGEKWNTVLEHYSEYSCEELEYAVSLICKSLYQVEFTNTGKKLSAIKKKYAESKNFGISDDVKIGQNKDMLYERARKAKEFLAEKFKK
jgi:hypothetical protein